MYQYIVHSVGRGEAAGQTRQQVTSAAGGNCAEPVFFLFFSSAFLLLFQRWFATCGLTRPAAAPACHVELSMPSYGFAI